MTGLFEDSLFVPKQLKQYAFFKDLFPVYLLTSYHWTILVEKVYTLFQLFKVFQLFQPVFNDCTTFKLDIPCAVQVE